MFIVKHRVVFFWLLGGLFGASVLSLIVFGLSPSIDFTGGSLVEVAYTNDRPALETVRERVSGLSVGEASVRESGEKGFVIRTPLLTPEAHDALIASLNEGGAAPLTELRFNSIGPSLGAELATKAMWAIGAVILTIVLYIAWAFRSVSRPVPSWGYGLIAVLMLAIDIIVPAGFYAAYGYFTGAQADTLFVVALLALLGYCVNDVIVIFDRIREHLRHNHAEHIDEPFSTTVGKSIDETMGRSINTGLTVVLALLALAFLGSEATRNFSIVMIVGVVAGTFSSITRSAPLLIPIAAWLQKERASKKRA